MLKVHSSTPIITYTFTPKAQESISSDHTSATLTSPLFHNTSVEIQLVRAHLLLPEVTLSNISLHSGTDFPWYKFFWS